MDRPPFGPVLELTAVASRSWADLSASLALEGIDVWSWSGRLLIDVVALLLKRQAGESADGEASAAIAQARAEQRYGGGDAEGWGTVTADEAARILAEQ